MPFSTRKHKSMKCDTRVKLPGHKVKDEVVFSSLLPCTNGCPYFNISQLLEEEV